MTSNTAHSTCGLQLDTYCSQLCLCSQLCVKVDTSYLVASACKCLKRHNTTPLIPCHSLYSLHGGPDFPGCKLSCSICSLFAINCKTAKHSGDALMVALEQVIFHSSGSRGRGEGQRQQLSFSHTSISIYLVHNFMDCVSTRHNHSAYLHQSTQGLN